MRGTLLERFNEKYMKEPDSGCWLWLAARSSYRYGCIGVPRNRCSYPVKFTMVHAHRVSWQLHRGKIPKGLSVLHKCDIPLCVNPNHLFLGTQEDNVRDMEKKKRARHPRGEKAGRAKLTEAKVRTIRKSKKPVKELADKYGVTRGAIRFILLRVSWRHVS